MLFCNVASDHLKILLLIFKSQVEEVPLPGAFWISLQVSTDFFFITLQILAYSFLIYKVRSNSLKVLYFAWQSLLKKCFLWYSFVGVEAHPFFSSPSSPFTQPCHFPCVITMIQPLNTSNKFNFLIFKCIMIYQVWKKYKTQYCNKGLYLQGSLRVLLLFELRDAHCIVPLLPSMLVSLAIHIYAKYIHCTLNIDYIRENV